MRHRFLVLCCAGLVGMLLLTGCRTFANQVENVKNNPGGTLENTDWTLDRFASQPGKTTKVLTGLQITIHFEAGRVTGSSTYSGYMDDYSGAFSVYENQLTINNVATGNRPGPAKVLAQENVFLYNDLQNSAKFMLAGDKLTILDGAGKTLAELSRYTPPTLSGTVWRVIGYANANGKIVPLIAGTKISAEFSPDGAVNGFAGCNQYTGKWTPSAASGIIAVGGLAAGKKTCASPPGIMRQEREYLKALSTAATYTMTASEMTFATESGSPAVKFSALK